MQSQARQGEEKVFRGRRAFLRKSLRNRDMEGVTGPGSWRVGPRTVYTHWKLP